MRRLVYIPVVHSSVEMGSEAERIRDVYIERHGHQAWEESHGAIAAFWARIENEINGLEFNFHKLRLYQDGLPVCGHEEEIVREIARMGSPNHRILLGLMAKGARLEGTEDPELLLEEHRLLKTTAAAPGQSEQGEAAIRDYEEETSRLLERRDRFIGARIDATLRPGKTGMLFIGALHSILEFLPKSIGVRQPLPWLQRAISD